MPGYLKYKLKIEIIRAVIYFGLVMVIFLLGYFQTHSKENLLTVVAVLGCLPACKVLVGVITRIPYHSIDAEVAKEIGEKSSNLTVLYDLVVTSKDKIMPIDAVVISDKKVYGYTTSKKVDLQYAASHIKTILENNHLEAAVKILNQYPAFIARVEGLNAIMSVEKQDTKEYEEKLARVIMAISL